MKIDRDIKNIRVLDLGWVWAGPLVGAALADLGMDVVKVESTNRFDPYRMRGVETREDLGEMKREASPSYQKLNRSKRSLTLDLKNDRGRHVFMSLVEQANVVVDNFQAGTLQKLGLGWDVLKSLNPNLVMLSMSAGGQEGRWANLRAYASITSALGGYESLIAYPNESPIGGSTFGVADPAVASFGVLAVLSALVGAMNGLGGAYLDLSGVESAIAMMSPALLMSQRGVERPYVEVTVRCEGADKWVAVVVDGQRDLDALALLAAGPPVIWPNLTDEELVTLRDTIERWSRSVEREFVLDELESRGLAAAAILTIEEANCNLDDRLVEIRHPLTGSSKFYRSPWGANRDEPTPAPYLGGHTTDILGEWLGLTDPEIEALRQDGALT